MKRRQRTHVMLDGERTTICGRTRVDAVLAMNGEDVTCTVCVQGLSYERMKKERDEARAEVAALREALKMTKPLGPEIDWSAPTVSMSRFIQEMRAWTRDLDDERWRAEAAERDAARMAEVLRIRFDARTETPEDHFQRYLREKAAALAAHEERIR